MTPSGTFKTFITRKGYTGASVSQPTSRDLIFGSIFEKCGKIVKWIDA